MTDDVTPHAADLKTQYADRIAEDLAHNESERIRIEKEITALKAELETLTENRAVLERMRDSLAEGVPGGGAQDTSPSPAPAAPSAPSAPTAVKKPTRKVPRQKSAAAKSKSVAKPASSATATQPGATTLIELITSQLSGADGTPRSASEIATALRQAHPDREFNPKVVRNTLEALVAKGRAERTRQKRSVFYVATRTA